MFQLDQMAPFSHDDFPRGAAHGGTIFKGSSPTDGANLGLFEKGIAFPAARSLPLNMAMGCAGWGSWDPEPEELP